MYSKPVFVQKYIVQHAAPNKLYFTYRNQIGLPKYILQHAAPKQNIFYVPKSNWSTKIYFTACSTKAKYILRTKIKLVYQEQYHLYEIITPRPIFLSRIQNQIWYLRNHIWYTKIYFPVHDITKWPSKSHFKFNAS